MRDEWKLEWLNNAWNRMEIKITKQWVKIEMEGDQ